MSLRRAWWAVALGLLALFPAAVACGGDDGEGPAEPTPVEEQTQEPTDAVGQGEELTVVSYNILHGLVDGDPAAEPYDRFPERIQLIAAALGELKPDIIMLQEVAPDKGPDYGDVDQILLAALGPEYQVVFGDISGNPIGGGGLGQMTLTRLPIVSSENYLIGGARSVHRVTVQTDKGPLDLYNPHLEGTGAVIDATLDDSVVEVRNLLDFISTTRSGTGPVIVGGDFNAEPQDPSIAEMLGEGFVDVLPAGGDATCEAVGDPGCTSGTIPLSEPGNRTDHRIDYVFVLDGSQVSIDVKEAALFLGEPVDIGDGQVLWASDHIGNQAVLELK